MVEPTLDHDAQPPAPRPVRTGLPFSAVLGVIAGLAIVGNAMTELRDIDLYWHVLAGRELLDGLSPSQLGQAWSFAPDPLPWTSTQWLAEILFAVLYNAAGWAGLAAFRVATAAIAITVLARVTLHRRPAALAGFPFLIAMVLIAFVSQERPQQFTFIGAAALGGVLVAGLVEQRLPRWWILAPPTALWANLHGGWVLVPVVMGLVALGALVDRGPRDPMLRRALGLAALATLAGCMTPSGLQGLLAPLRFSSAAELVNEWEAVRPTTALGWVSILMLVLFLVGWSASRMIPRSELVAVVALLVFTWLAWRNLTPGMALLAPLAAHRLVEGFPGVGRPEPRWSVPVGIASAGALTVLALGLVTVKDHLPRTEQPFGLIERIGGLPAGQRVLNDYNVAGAVLFFGGDGVQVAIDGRTDRYGADYIEAYTSMLALRGEWSALLEELDPNAALVKGEAAIAHVLTSERGWQQLGEEENGFVLLVPGAGA
jgi:hypothetical protein